MILSPQNFNDEHGRIKSNLGGAKRNLTQKFAVLKNDDLLFEQGKKEEMLGKILVKLGKTKEELLKIIEAL